jgi:hypothetical protein
MALADGRRTARDIAFVLGRGVYGTMLQLARMYHAGLLVTSPQGGASQPAARQASHPAGGEQQADSGLPRRNKSLPRRPGSRP